MAEQILFTITEIEKPEEDAVGSKINGTGFANTQENEAMGVEFEVTMNV